MLMTGRKKIIAPGGDPPPASPGATPEKISPPPITTAISSPSAATWAISPTMRSMVARLIPKGSSPMRASPLSLSKMRLYFAVAGISACPGRAHLSSYLGGEIAGFPLNALPDYLQDKARYRGARALEQGFHGLLSSRILDEDLTEQRDFLQKFLTPSFDHL